MRPRDKSKTLYLNYLNVDCHLTWQDDRVLLDDLVDDLLVTQSYKITGQVKKVLVKLPQYMKPQKLAAWLLREKILPLGRSHDRLSKWLT